MERFLRESKRCEVSENNCAKVIAEYPVAVEGDEEIRSFINDTVFYHVLFTLSGFVTSEEELVEDLETVARRFITDYEKFADEQGGEYRVGWTIETTGEVLYQSPDIVSIGLKNFSYTGGAHPNSYFDLLNFDLREKKMLQLGDLINDLASFETIVEKHFRKYHQLDEKADFNKAGFFWDGAFSLPANYALKEEGIYLYYNKYEVAPYAVGATELLIPWRELKGVLVDKWSF